MTKFGSELAKISQLAVQSHPCVDQLFVLNVDHFSRRPSYLGNLKVTVDSQGNPSQKGENFHFQVT